MSEAEYKLGVHCGVTFAGIKPASLFRMKTEEVATALGVVKYFLKRGFGVKWFQGEKIGSLLYIYNERQLCERLFEEENRKFLEEEGYTYTTLEEAMRQLRARLHGEEFPHEIGVFLGYPLEDVKGFIRSPYSGYTTSGYWKVYANEAQTLRIFERYKRCSACICHKMDDGKSLAQIFHLV